MRSLEEGATSPGQKEPRAGALSSQAQRPGVREGLPVSESCPFLVG